MAKVMISFGGETLGEYPVEEPAAVVGRDAGCHIRIDNLGVSRAHCQIIKRAEGYVLQDMNSANGTFVNGSRVGEQLLKEGDEILVGKYTLKFSHEAAATPAPQHAADQADMGDGIHTYVMDGEKIRERLGQMQAGGGPPEAQPERAKDATRRIPPLPGMSAPSTPTPAPAAAGPRRAKDHALDFDPLKPQSPIRARSPTQRYNRPPPAPGAPGGGANVLLYMSLATNLILIVLVGVLIAFLWKMMQAPAPAPAPVPALTTPPLTAPAVPAEGTETVPTDDAPAAPAAPVDP